MALVKFQFNVSYFQNENKVEKFDSQNSIYLNGTFQICLLMDIVQSKLKLKTNIKGTILLEFGLGLLKSEETTLISVSNSLKLVQIY
jgi:hypothetical protein